MEHYNKLTPAEDERLSCLLEEMGEAIQVIGKIQRHGYENYHPEDPDKTTNRTLLATEIGHVCAIIHLMTTNQDVSRMNIDTSISEKIIAIKRWMHHQQD